MKEKEMIKASKRRAQQMGRKARFAEGNRWKIAAAGAFVFYGLLLNFLSRSVPGFSEWHVRYVFPFFSDGVARLTGLLPFSILELCIYLIAGSAVWHLAHGIAFLVRKLLSTLHMRRNKEPAEKTEQPQEQAKAAVEKAELWQGRTALPSRYIDRLCSIFCAASLLFAVASASCLANYGRSTAAELLGLSVQPSSAAELKELCGLLVEDAAAVIQSISLDSEGRFTIGDCDVGQEARDAMEYLGESYEILKGYYPQPKPVLWSEGMSYINLTGIYSVFTIEANYNAAVTDYVIPYTICHELSHLRGFIREDEAGFLAWLACFHSESPRLRYSGALNALNYSLNALYREVSYEEYAEFYNSMPMQIRWDLWNNSLYWRRHRTITYEMGRAVNDAYLKVNAQEGGVKSYGRMVDLLLAYRRAGAELI